MKVQLCRIFVHTIPDRKNKPLFLPYHTSKIRHWQDKKPNYFGKKF